MKSTVYLFLSDEIALTASRELPVMNTALEGLPCASRMHAVFGSEPVDILLIDTAHSGQALSACGSGTGAAFSWVPLRSLFAEDEPFSAVLGSYAGRAYGLINWHASTRFCSRCGGPLAAHPTETARQCVSCGTDYYPRLAPAIIVLVHRGEEILLVRHSHRIQHLFSCVAGYVEHGETLEHCVEREVQEETGIRVKNIRYAGSQSWPFPDQYMIAFHADWASGELVPDGEEILEARWFSRDALPNIPSRASVAWKLIMGDTTA